MLPMIASEVPIYVGWSPEEMRAWNVAQMSMRRYSTGWLDIYRVSRLELEARGLYTRGTHTRAGKRWDIVSDAPMTTDHAIARFFVPLLRDFKGWALFTDGDVMLRHDITELIALADPRYAVMCVQHAPGEGGASWETKKNGQLQVPYPRKNWSSVMLWNCAHLANKSLTTHTLNHVPGRDLHRFCWLADSEIGALPPEWNYLVGVSPTLDEPKLVHFTLGTPDLPDHEYSYYDSEWREYARLAGYHLTTGTERIR